MAAIWTRIQRWFSLDNLIGGLVVNGLFLAGTGVAGWLLNLPPIPLAAMVLGVGYVTVAGTLAWREGWRPGRMRGTRGWRVEHILMPAAASAIGLSLYPPEGVDPRGLQVRCEITNPKQEPYVVPHLVQPGQAGAHGEWNRYWFTSLPRGEGATLDDGRYSVRWRFRSALGWQPAGEDRFRIKRGRLV